MKDSSKKDDPTSLSPDMALYLQAVAEHGTGAGVPSRTAKALERRGLAKVAGGASMSRAVCMRATPAGVAEAVRLFQAEHEERLSKGEKSERIPRIIERLSRA